MSIPVARWPYVLLALLALATTLDQRPALAELVLCVVVAAWLAAGTALRVRPWVVAVGLTVLTGALVVLNPLFGFLTPVPYFYTFRTIAFPWQPVGVAAVAVVAGTAQAYGVDKSTAGGVAIWLAVIAGNAVPMCAYAFVARRAEQQEAEREQALAQAREANRRLAESLADNATLHEQLVVQAREAGVRDERQRMAREIHDTLAQGLTGIISQLRAADDRTWARHVAAATELARESLDETRRSVSALRPEPLRTARLTEALTGVAGKWSALHGIPVEVTTTGDARLIAPEAEFALLRAAQEALANVARHARASRVGVTLSYLEGEVALDVRDDGRGFGDVRPGGFGLEAMRQRIEGLAGTVQIESEPGAGTGVSARVPLEART
ncbi:sensor histidine kinase [Lentzea flaviverrucosa]|uniref:Signal transduction histidine kinase n=1 Tax=Lentzea flaviverrucosa TaxID=200379 RepID=A0A1H9KQG8_9PSEU|nr:sensor histidine kinase [Lentzea flaviverrucosa]RDI17949.1 signal transduction histidine kinase [Lentzea flaviverrucosa]SER01083.1 Signal transduction histidine kinase [Lentzea flaviverrucosa]